jgi:hypothetical protein
VRSVMPTRSLLPPLPNSPSPQKPKRPKRNKRPAFVSGSHGSGAQATISPAESGPLHGTLIPG